MVGSGRQKRSDPRGGMHHEMLHACDLQRSALVQGPNRNSNSEGGWHWVRRLFSCAPLSNASPAFSKVCPFSQIANANGCQLKPWSRSSTSEIWNSPQRQRGGWVRKTPTHLLRCSYRRLRRCASWNFFVIFSTFSTPPTSFLRRFHLRLHHHHHHHCLTLSVVSLIASSWLCIMGTW